MGLRLDRKSSGTERILPCLRGSPSIFSADLFCDDQPDSTDSHLLADFRPRHSLHFRTFSVVRVKSGLASTSATDIYRVSFVSDLSRLQSALGRPHTY